MPSQCANCARHYEILVRDQLGNNKFVIFDAYTVKWVLRLNKPGVLTMELPLDDCTDACEDGYRITDFDEDYRIEVYRQLTSPTGAYMAKSLVGEAPFMVTRLEASRKEDGRRILYVEAETPLGLLGRRINPYSAERNASDLGARACDDQMKYIMRNNYTGIAESYAGNPDPLRTAILTYLSIEPDEAAITAQFQGDIENANILSTLQKISEFAKSKNENLFFDIVQTSNTTNPFLQFRTYAGVRGTDRTIGTAGANGIMLLEDVQVGEYTLTYNWSDTVNRIYAASKSGEGAGREYVTSDDPGLVARLAVNPFALREDFISSTSDDDDDILIEADLERQSRSNVFTVSGNIVESGSFTYACDAIFGDMVTVRVACQTVDVFLDTEEITLEEGAEKVVIGFSTDFSLYRRTGGIGQLVSDVARLERDLATQRRIERA